MNSVLAGLSCSRREAYKFADGLAETELLRRKCGHRIEYRRQTDDIELCAWTNASSILGITDKHCLTKAAALGDTWDWKSD